MESSSKTVTGFRTQKAHVTRATVRAVRLHAGSRTVSSGSTVSRSMSWENAVRATITVHPILRAARQRQPFYPHP